MDTHPPVPHAVIDLLLALGDEQRLRVLSAFVDARSWELPATAIARHCEPLSRPAVSHHLGLMRRAGVLTARREGKRIYYAIDRTRIEHALRSYLAFLDVCCPPSGGCGPAPACTEVP